MRDEIKNSLDNLASANRTLHTFGSVLELCKEARLKYPEFVLPYYHILWDIFAAVSIVFGLAKKEDFSEVDSCWIDSPEFISTLSDFITEHLDTVCSKVSSKHQDSKDTFRRSPKKILNN